MYAAPFGFQFIETVVYKELASPQGSHEGKEKERLVTATGRPRYRKRIHTALTICQTTLQERQAQTIMMAGLDTGQGCLAMQPS